MLIITIDNYVGYIVLLAMVTKPICEKKGVSSWITVSRIDTSAVSVP